MEKLLHYVWKHKLLPLHALQTTDGRDLEIIDPGTHNNDAGPDFFNAKVRMDGTLWAGNVEIHLRSSDWYRHGHNMDPAYNNTILHIAQVVDCDVETEDGRHPAQLELEIPAQLAQHYEELCDTTDYPRCHKMIPHLDVLEAHSWMDSLLAERLTERSKRVLDRAKEHNGDWEQATFVTLSRNFGFGLNGDAFEMWAKRIPLQAVAKHRDNLFQVEAIFLGMGGLIEESFPKEQEAERTRMKQEFAYLTHKFNLPTPLQTTQWKYLRTRPTNFPHIRLKQLACLYHEGRVQMSTLLEAEDVKALHKCLSIGGTSVNSQNLLIINTVVPLLYAYGAYTQNTDLQDRAIRLLEELPAEKNFILRQWADCGLKVESAADSQALIQLKREYCDKLDCLRCRFGYKYLKS